MVTMVTVIYKVATNIWWYPKSSLTMNKLFFLSYNEGGGGGGWDFNVIKVEDIQLSMINVSKKGVVVVII